jgi:hypothetical protein
MALEWNNRQKFPGRVFICGFCSAKVGPDEGYFSNDPSRGGQSYILICSSCRQPTYFDAKDQQWPGVPFGAPVGHLPADVKQLYEEARNCMTVKAYTAAVLVCRKLLMNLAVNKGANSGESFISYVEYLSAKGYVPPDGKGWVDHIRQKGNEANHEIKIMGRDEAEQLISFSEMLLKFVYEFPARVPSTAIKPSASTP